MSRNMARNSTKKHHPLPPASGPPEYDVKSAYRQPDLQLLLLRMVKWKALIRLERDAKWYVIVLPDGNDVGNADRQVVYRVSRQSSTLRKRLDVPGFLPGTYLCNCTVDLQSIEIGATHG